MLAGIPIGVAYAHEPPMTQAMSTARGSAFIPWAIERQMGAMRAVVAVLLMKFVITQHSMNTTNVNTVGEGFSPNAPITVSAMSLPAPVLSRADARERVPPNRNIVLRSMDFSASSSEITPVRMSSTAPMHPTTLKDMPICFSKIIPSSVATRMMRDKFFFH